MPILKLRIRGLNLEYSYSHIHAADCKGTRRNEIKMEINPESQLTDYDPKNRGKLNKPKALYQ